MYKDGDKYTKDEEKNPEVAAANTEFCRSEDSANTRCQIVPITEWNWKNLDIQGEGDLPHPLDPPISRQNGFLWNEVDFQFNTLTIYCWWPLKLVIISA